MLYIFTLVFLLISSFSFSEEVKIIATEENIEQLLEIDPSNIDFLYIYAVKLVKTGKAQSATEAVPYTHLTLPTNREV